MTLPSSTLEGERQQYSARPIPTNIVSRIVDRLRDHCVAARNRLLADAGFQRWAADYPLTRGIARARARALFDLVAGFVYSQTLLTCVEAGLLERLRDGPQGMSALARGLGLPPDAAMRLLRAAAALGLVEELSENRYTLGPQGAAMAGNAGLVEMIKHHRLFYADLIDGVEPMRDTRGHGNLAAYWPYASSVSPERASPDSVAAYSALMAASQPSVAEDILHAYDLRRHRRLMDVGGGQGAFLVAAGTRLPGLDLMLFDLPAVAERAEEALGRAGLLARAEIVSGDFLCGPLPTGSDVITLIRILHDHDDEGVLTLLSSARAALPSNGVLLIAEPMSAAPRPDRVADVYFAFYLLAMGRGRARTPAEIIALTKAAGFRQAQIVRTRTPFLLRVIVARP
jgi:demethylspheroidene O-methyltransferase